MVFTGKLLTEEVIEQYNFTVGLIARRRRKKWVWMCTEYDFVKENESVWDQIVQIFACGASAGKPVGLSCPKSAYAAKSQPKLGLGR